MKKCTIFSLAMLGLPLFSYAQLRVTTDGQVQMDAGSGKVNEVTTIQVNSNKTTNNEGIAQEQLQGEWYPVGAVWHYQVERNFSPPLHRISCQKYSVVSSQQKGDFLEKKIELIETNHLGQAAPATYHYRYVKGNKIYEQRADSTCLLYDFDAQPGQRLDIYVHRYDLEDQHPEAKNTKIYFKLNRYETLLDEQKKPIRKAVMDLYSWSAEKGEAIIESHRVLERMGTDYIYDLGFSYGRSIDYMGDNYLRCYADGIIQYQEPKWKNGKWYARNPDCQAVFDYYGNYPTSMDPVQENAEEKAFVVYNPFTRELRLDSGSSWVKSCLYAMDGSRLSVAGEAQILDLSPYEGMTILVQITLKSGRLISQKISVL